MVPVVAFCVIADQFCRFRLRNAINLTVNHDLSRADLRSAVDRGIFIGTHNTNRFIDVIDIIQIILVLRLAISPCDFAVAVPYAFDIQHIAFQHVHQQFCKTVFCDISFRCERTAVKQSMLRRFRYISHRESARHTAHFVISQKIHHNLCHFGLGDVVVRTKQSVFRPVNDAQLLREHNGVAVFARPCHICKRALLL